MSRRGPEKRPKFKNHSEREKERERRTTTVELGKYDCTSDMRGSMARKRAVVPQVFRRNLFSDTYRLLSLDTGT